MTEIDFHAILGIPEVVIQKTELNSDDEFIIYVESSKEGATCHCCGKHTNALYGFDREQKIRHLSIFGKPSYVLIKQPRYQCQECQNKPVTTQQQSWRTRNCPNTIPFEKHIMLSLINSTIEDISAKESIGYGAIEGILERHINSEVDWKEIKSLEVIGIDEVSMRKGHKDFATLVTARDEVDGIRILAVLKGRKKDTVKKFSLYSQEVTQDSSICML
jgi:transposase